MAGRDVAGCVEPAPRRRRTVGAAERFHQGMAPRPHDLFTRTTFRLMNRWTAVAMFRKLAHMGEPHALDRLLRENLAISTEYLTQPEYEHLFRDKQRLIEIAGGAFGMASTITSNQRAGFRAMLDATSLVFMHSALDGVAADYCRVSADVSPDDWEPFVEERKTALKATKAADYATLLRQQVSAHLDDLARDSLLKKVDRLFQVCKPGAGLEVKPGYVFDRSRLEKLDSTRHDIVHGSQPLVPLGGVDDDLQYLFDTGWLLTTLLNRRYDVRIDPDLPGAWGA